MISIGYQVYSFVILLFNNSVRNCVFPVSEQTARLLLCCDFRCMALIVEKFSLTYYTNLFGWKLHTPRMLAFIKCFCEDLPQFSIQVYYVISREEGKITSPLILMSMSSSLISLIISFIAYIIATSSILSNRDLEELKRLGILKNFSYPRGAFSESWKRKKEERIKHDVSYSLFQHFLNYTFK